MSWPDLTAFWLSLQLGVITVVILLGLGVPLAWWLARSKSRFKPLIETLVALPLVLPPTVLGFYLLLLLGPQGWLGGWWLQMTGSTLTFSFTGLVIASVLYSLPFVVQPIQAAFTAVPKHLLEVASTLGADRMQKWRRVILPMSRHALVAGAVMGFAHTLGEFGVVLMVGGNIPGETQVVAIDIYNHVEQLNYAEAHGLSALLLVVSFVLILTIFTVQKRWQR